MSSKVTLLLSLCPFARSDLSLYTSMSKQSKRSKTVRDDEAEQNTTRLYQSKVLRKVLSTKKRQLQGQSDQANTRTQPPSPTQPGRLQSMFRKQTCFNSHLWDQKYEGKKKVFPITLQKYNDFLYCLPSLEGTDSLILSIRSWSTIATHITSAKDREAIVIFISMRTY